MKFSGEGGTDSHQSSSRVRSDMIHDSATSIFFTPFFSSVRIRWADVRRDPVILVYQMGKVGSSSVYSSLKQARLLHPVYQVHFLSADGLENALHHSRSCGKRNIPLHVALGKVIRRKIEQCRNVQWKLITLVRDPVSRSISDFFENFASYCRAPGDAGRSFDIEEAVALLQEKFVGHYDEDTDYVCTWFDREIKRVFHVDVYAHRFDRAQGYDIIRREDCDLLIFRVEDLDRNFEKAVMQFLELERPIGMLRSNVTREKALADSYRAVMREMILPREVCRKVYSSRYVRHFYSEEMIDTFIARWSGPE
jgi:hypothetical protein